MKVVQVLPELHGGGVERGTLEIARFLAQQGHESHVVSAGGPLVEELTAQGSYHHQCEVVAKSPRSFVGVFQLRRLLSTLQPDIVHVRSRIPGWVVELAYKALPRAKRPVRISTFHGFHSINCYSAIMTHGERIIAVSQTIARHIEQAYAVPSEKIEIIYRGVDPEYFDPSGIDSDKVATLRTQWRGADNCAPILLMPGRFTRLKGHALLLEALHQLKDLQWHLVLIGNHDENPAYTQELRETAKQHGLEGRLYFHGQSSDMPLMYAASDVVLNVSTRPESFGRTAVEAMAMEKPIIVSGHGGSLETLVADKTGWSFIPNDASSLAETLRKALNWAEQWEDIGRFGRRHVSQHFLLQTMCEQTLQLYKKVTA